MYLVLFLISLIPFTIGCLMQLSVSLVRNSHRAIRTDSSKLFLRIFGGLFLAVNSIGALGCLFQLLLGFLDGLLSEEVIFASAIGLVGFSLLAFFGWVIYGLHRVIPFLNDAAAFDAVGNKLKALVLFGWLLIVLAGVMSLPVLVLPGILCLAVCVTILGVRQKAQQSTVLWHLAIAMEHGEDLAEELEILSQTLWGKARRQLYTVSGLLKAGVSLPEALDQVPGLIPDSARLAAHSGESTGNLTQVFREAAVNHTNNINGIGTEKLTGLMIYLWLVPFVAFSMISFVMYYIVPKFKKIFANFGTELPSTTVGLIEVTDFVINYFYIVVPILSIPAIALFIGNTAYLRGWGEYDVRILSRFFQRFDTPGILRNLSQVVAAQQPIQEGLSVLACNHRRENMRFKLTLVLELVHSGNDCWTALRQQGVLTAREQAVLQSASRVGNLPWTLKEVSTSIERRLSYRLMAWAQWIEPAVVLVIGGMVMFIMVALFMPLVKLLNDLS